MSANKCRNGRYLHQQFMVAYTAATMLHFNNTITHTQTHTHNITQDSHKHGYENKCATSRYELNSLLSNTLALYQKVICFYSLILSIKLVSLKLLVILFHFTCIGSTCVLFFQKWIWCYRSSCLFVVNTNNGIEAQNKVLKYNYLAPFKTKSVCNLAECLIDEFFPDSYRK